MMSPDSLVQHVIRSSPRCPRLTIFPAGDIDDGGLGILLRDQDYTNNLQAHYFFLYENARDTQPWKYTLVSIPPCLMSGVPYQLVDQAC